MAPNLRRRDTIKGIGALSLAGLAGCLDEDDPDEPTNGEEPAPRTEFAPFDPEDPEFPQLASTLIDNNFDFATVDLIDQMEERDEPYYGAAPPEPPTDEDEFIDPDTLVYSYLPGEDAAVYRDAFDDVMANIETETGREVEFAPVDSFAAQVEAMRSERLHVCGFSVGSVAFAVNLAGAVPFAMKVGDGLAGYRLWVITQADNDDINTMADLEGTTFAHVEEASNSGHLAPMALFPEYGITPGEDYDIEFSGAHDNTVLGVNHGDYDAGAMASVIIRRMAGEDVVDPDDFKVIWASQPFPQEGYSYRYNLAPEIREGIIRAHLDYDYSGTQLEEFFDQDEFVPIDYATHWDIILRIQEEADVDYEV